MIGRQARIIATMLLGAMLIAAGILFFFPAHAGVSRGVTSSNRSLIARPLFSKRQESEKWKTLVHTLRMCIDVSDHHS
jgi:hypothetical protein